MIAYSRRIKNLTLITMCLALFMVMLDSTVVNLALPAIQKDLSASMSELQWIVDAFVLALASLLLTGGTLGDIYGRRKAFVVGVSLFTAGSVACALAPSSGVLIAARVVQGIGGAAMMPGTLSIITNVFPDVRERSRAIGMWAGISGLALAVGPVVGGLMVDHLGWQSIFWINVPIGAATLLMARVFVPESSDRAGRTIDLPGQITAVLGLAALTYAFIEANTYGWTSPRILGCFIIAGVSLALFFLIELRSDSALLQVRLFRNPTFGGGNLVATMVNFAFFGIVFYISLFLQEVQHYSPTKAGLLQLPCALGIIVAAVLSGRIVARVGARLPIVAGQLIGGVGLLALTTLEPTTSYASFWYWLLVTGVGMGLVLSPTTNAVMGTVPPARAGMASATTNTMRQVGSVFGIAVLGNLVTNGFIDHLRTSLTDMHLPPATTQRIMAIAGKGLQSMAGGSQSSALARQLGSTVESAFTQGLHAALWVSGIVMLVGAPVALFTVRFTAPHHVEARHQAAQLADELAAAQDADA